MGAHNDPLNALGFTDVNGQLEKLANGYGRNEPKDAMVHVWVARLRESRVKPKELEAAADYVLDTLDRFPSVAQLLAAVQAVRSASFVKREAKRDEERKEWEIEEPERYEEWRQWFKRQHNIGVETPEKVRRYGFAIKPTKWAPSIVRDITAPSCQPELELTRGGGPRRAF